MNNNNRLLCVILLGSIDDVTQYENSGFAEDKVPIFFQRYASKPQVLPSETFDQKIFDRSINELTNVTDTRANTGKNSSSIIGKLRVRLTGALQVHKQMIQRHVKCMSVYKRIVFTILWILNNCNVNYHIQYLSFVKYYLQ